MVTVADKVLLSVQAELKVLKQTFHEQERRLSAMRATPSPSGASPGTPTPLPRSGLPQRPHTEADQRALDGATDAEKRELLDRYTALLRSCDRNSSVRVQLRIVGDHVNVSLDVVPAASLVCDKVQSNLDSMGGAVHGHLHSMSGLMHGLMAIAHNELVGLGGGAQYASSVPQITGGVSEAGMYSALEVQHSAEWVPEATYSLASTAAGSLAETPSRDMAQRCDNMLELLNNLTPRREVRSACNGPGAQTLPASFFRWCMQSGPALFGCPVYRLRLDLRSEAMHCLMWRQRASRPSQLCSHSSCTTPAKSAHGQTSSLLFHHICRRAAGPARRRSAPRLAPAWRCRARSRTISSACCVRSGACCTSSRLLLREVP
jgi:hypothetical protein